MTASLLTRKNLFDAARNHVGSLNHITTAEQRSTINLKGTRDFRFIRLNGDSVVLCGKTQSAKAALHLGFARHIGHMADLEKLSFPSEVYSKMGHIATKTRFGREPLLLRYVLRHLNEYRAWSYFHEDGNIEEWVLEWGILDRDVPNYKLLSANKIIKYIYSEVSAESLEVITR